MESYNNLADLLEEVALTSKKKPIRIKEIFRKTREVWIFTYHAHSCITFYATLSSWSY
jgi:hypothetical protein